MKKLITIVLLAALALPAIAQELVTEEQAQPLELAQPQQKEHKWTVRGSAGYYPTIPQSRFL
ncbi:MAG: hypothetical protein J6X25_06550, partial [Bacteroidales bacterium]|nr:hypothetical protein [Bacteroidales bacterium]